MKVRDLIVETEQLESPELHMKLMRARLRKLGLDPVVGKSVLWNFQALRFTVDTDVTYELAQISLGKWAAYRFAGGDFVNAEHYDNEKTLLTAVAKGDWLKKVNDD